MEQLGTKAYNWVMKVRVNAFDRTLHQGNRQGARGTKVVLKGLNRQSDVTRVASRQLGTDASIG